MQAVAVVVYMQTVPLVVLEVLVEVVRAVRVLLEQQEL
jgi:hypothetical protein